MPFALRTGAASVAELPVVTPSSVNPLDGPFLGFGAEWDVYGYEYYKINEDDFKLIERRLKWMRLPLTRVMMLANWCYLGNGRYNWDSTMMKYLCRQLDACQAQGIPVLLTEWGVNDSWLRVPGIQQIDDPRYAEVIGAYLDYLIREKKYTCIRYFIFVNEPGPSATRAAWLAGLANVAAELKKRGLDRQIRLTAPDQSGNRFDLIPETVAKIGPALGAFDLHYYVNERKQFSITAEAAQSGEIRRYFTEAWKQARTLDPDRTKPLLIGEAGFFAWQPEVEKTSGAAHNAWNRDWRYGLYMAQYAVQAVEAGTWGISAWMLDDSSHVNFNWGLWGNKTENFALKPWFYVWSLLSRNFPPNSSFSLIQNAPAGLQILAAKLPSSAAAGSAGWSLCVVNPGKSEIVIRLRLTGAPSAPHVRYLYREKQARVDAEGFPEPVTRWTPQWDAGETLVCPAESVQFIVPADLLIKP